MNANFPKLKKMLVKNGETLETHFSESEFETAEDIINECCMIVEFTASMVSELGNKYGAMFVDDRLQTICPEMIFAAVAGRRLEDTEEQVVH
tara:strand:+ start:85 stop:360 length:276 start_codon:yes stop_codon:yes gene_type:complete